MERKSMPPAVVISIIVLGLTSIVGVLGTSADLGLYVGGREVAFPYGLIGGALIFAVVPVVAIWDMLRGNSPGRYLAILSLLCLWALFLRQFTSVLSLPAITLQQIWPIIPILFGIVASLPALILFLGFNNKVATYFSPNI